MLHFCTNCGARISDIYYYEEVSFDLRKSALLRSSDLRQIRYTILHIRLKASCLQLLDGLVVSEAGQLRYIPRERFLDPPPLLSIFYMDLTESVST